MCFVYLHINRGWSPQHSKLFKMIEVKAYVVKQIKDSDIDEEQLRSAVTKAYDKLEEMGIGKEEVKGILHKLADFAKSLFE